MDVHNAFLHGDLSEEVYIRPLPRFHTSSLIKICKLRKSLYGLRQAPRCWFSKFTTVLWKCGFVQSHVDYSLFTYIVNSVFLCVLIYVDDLLITGNSFPSIAKFKAYLNSCFSMKDLGPLKYFLGIEVTRNSFGIYVCQRK